MELGLEHGDVAGFAARLEASRAKGKLRGIARQCRADGAEAAEASANPPGCWVSAPTATAGACGTAASGAWALAGITISLAAFATTPHAIAPLTHASEINPTRIDFIVIPTLPLDQSAGSE